MWHRISFDLSPTNGARRSIEFCLERFGAQVSHRAMLPPAVIEHFNQSRDRLQGLLLSGAMFKRRLSGDGASDARIKNREVAKEGGNLRRGIPRATESLTTDVAGANSSSAN